VVISLRVEVDYHVDHRDSCLHYPAGIYTFPVPWVVYLGTVDGTDDNLFLRELSVQQRQLASSLPCLHLPQAEVL
jgi:hypothetical protein